MERQEQLQELRARILQTEEDRLHGARAMSIAETREAMKKVPASINADDMTVDELRVELLAGYNDMNNGNVHDASSIPDRFKDRETRKNDGVEEFSSPSKV
jgi:hypothetical protein